MDGKGRAIDNAFIERLWRSVKYEKLYLYPPKDGIELYQSLAEYFNYYNHERRHSGINNQIPNQKYIQQVKRLLKVNKLTKTEHIYQTKLS